MRARAFLLVVSILLLAGCSTAAAQQPAQTPTNPARPAIAWIQMVDRQTGWAITADTGRLVRTRDGGGAWQDVTPQVEMVRNTSSFFLDGSTAFVEGFNEEAPANSTGTLFITRDGGQTWASHATPFAGGSLHFQDASTGWAVSVPWSAGTATAALVYQTTDGGTSWSLLNLTDPQGAQPAGFPAGSVQLTGGETLAVHSPTNLWLGGGSTAAPAQNIRLWGSWDGGQTWQAEQVPSPIDSETLPTQITSGLPVFVNEKFAFFTAAFVLSAEGGGNPRNVMAFYTSQDGGKTWQLLPSLVQGAGQDDQANFLSDQVAFVRCGEAVCATRDAGASWQAITANLRFSPDQNLALEQLDFLDEQTGWAVTPRGLYRTVDGGEHWVLP